MKFAAVLLVCILGLSEGFVDKTVIQWLKDDGGFTSLVTALSTAGLETALSGPGPITIFAPTDAAFGRLGTKNVNKLLQNPLQLSLILKYHVLNEFLVAPMIKSRTTKYTAEGESLVIEPNNGGLFVNNYAKVDIGNEDIIVNNGVIHPISNVLLPDHLPVFTIAQYLLQDDKEFNDLSLAVHFANLTSLLDGGEYTFFATNDSIASSTGASGIMNPNAPNAQAVYQAILKYHIVKGTVLSGQLSDGQTLTTIHGTTLTVHIDSAGVKINNSPVIQTDILCLNGVIHSIAGILIPQDIATVTQG